MLQYLLDRAPLPKVISPKTHKILDYLTISTFLITAAVWWKSHRRASIGSLANGLFVLSYTPFTDYDGDRKRPISFHTHGNLDRIQAGMAAIAPEILSFSEDRHAAFFRGQALNETAVIGLTDFEAGRRGLRKLRRAA